MSDHDRDDHLVTEFHELQAFHREAIRAADEREAEAAALARHNAEFDRWGAMTPAEREREIRDAMRLA